MTRVSTVWKPEGDQQILYMGEIKVGRVMASGGPRSMFHLKSFASWAKARTMEHAKLSRHYPVFLAPAGFCSARL